MASLLINTELTSLFAVLANPDTEGPIEAKKFQAYVLQTTIRDDNEMVPVKLISMQSPVSTLSNRFILGIERRNFHEITEPVLTLKRSIDVIILGRTVYMLTLPGENLFAMERALDTIISVSMLFSKSCFIRYMTVLIKHSMKY